MNIDASSEQVLDYVLSRLEATKVNLEPFPHFVVGNVFPTFFLEMALASLPPDEAYTDRSFENRAMAFAHTCGPFWKSVSQWMLSNDLCGPLLKMLHVPPGNFAADVRLLKDSEGYKIKPHTDIKAKVASFLFYLDPDGHPELGTTVYTPKNHGFTSDGTSRYEYEDFDEVFTAPFVPNTLFGFARSDVSFHGVRPTKIGPRHQLLLNVYRHK